MKQQCCQGTVSQHLLSVLGSTAANCYSYNAATIDGNDCCENCMDGRCWLLPNAGVVQHVPTVFTELGCLERDANSDQDREGWKWLECRSPMAHYRAPRHHGRKQQVYTSLRDVHPQGHTNQALPSSFPPRAPQVVSVSASLHARDLVGRCMQYPYSRRQEGVGGDRKRA